ncbi:MAG TPA: Gfo/Idh/MocA family oxidoreductase [Ilumatobacteraceae bacterium]
MTQLRWGIIGATSGIYRGALAPAFAASDRHEVVAEASRRDGNEAPYAELMTRTDVDAVYIPLPNNGHKEWILRALEAGKHVLCEKPLTMSLADTQEVFAAASSAGRVLMEAYMWPHHPRARRILGLVADGELGELRSVRSTFTYASSDPTNHRFDERGAGALFDVGIYCIGPAMMAAQRDHVDVAACAVRNANGVDISMTGFIDWGDSLGSSFDVSFEAPPRRALDITGTEGILTVPGWHAPGPEEPSEIHVQRRDEVVVLPVEGGNAFVGMVDQFAAVIDEVEAPVFGRRESERLAAVIDALQAASR